MSLNQLKAIKITSLDDAIKVGKIAHESGLFNTLNSADSTIRILTGLELGIPAVTSIMSIFILHGKMGIAYPMIAALIKKSSKYDYSIEEHTKKLCSLRIYQEGKEVGTVTFTIEDAEKAGLTKNPSWTKYTVNMLFARALTNAARFYCADIFSGSIYTPDELDATLVVDEKGNPVNEINKPKTHVDWEVVPPSVEEFFSRFEKIGFHDRAQLKEILTYLVGTESLTMDDAENYYQKLVAADVLDDISYAKFISYLEKTYETSKEGLFELFQVFVESVPDNDDKLTMRSAAVKDYARFESYLKEEYKLKGLMNSLTKTLEVTEVSTE